MKLEEFILKEKEPGIYFEIGIGALDEFAEEWKRQPSGTLQPLSDKLVLETIESDTEIMGLSIPETAREKPMKGIVVAVNETSKTIKVGDVVLYGKHAGVDVFLDGKSYLLMRESDIFAII